MTPTAPGAGTSFGILQITFFSGANGTGGNLGTIDVSNGNTPTGAGNAQGSQQINSASQTGVWIPLDTGIAQAPTGSQSLEVFTLVVDQNPTKVYFDNLDLTQVPEPSAFALFALAGGEPLRNAASSENKFGRLSRDESKERRNEGRRFFIAALNQCRHEVPALQWIEFLRQHDNPMTEN